MKSMSDMEVKLLISIEDPQIARSIDGIRDIFRCLCHNLPTMLAPLAVDYNAYIGVGKQFARHLDCRNGLLHELRVVGRGDGNAANAFWPPHRLSVAGQMVPSAVSYCNRWDTALCKNFFDHMIANSNWACSLYNSFKECQGGTADDLFICEDGASDLVLPTTSKWDQTIGNLPKLLT